jgi:hypothetical protein
MTQPNVLCINGMGGSWTSGSLYALWQRMTEEFGRGIYAPPPVNYKETGMILRYFHKTVDPWIMVGLSCGCSTINAVANAAPTEKIVHAFYYSPSMYCGVGEVSMNVAKATQVSSWPFDFFNPGSRQLIVPKGSNKVTVFNTIQTNLGHGFTCSSPAAQAQLFDAIRKQKGS